MTATLWTVKASNYGDINRIANRMRAVDRVECEAVGHSPKAALVAAFRSSSLCWTVLADGKPCAIFGVAAISAIEGRGAVWMLGTDEITAARKPWLAWAPQYLGAMHRAFQKLENWISVENDASARWLRKLQFRFDEETVLIGGVPHRRFYRGF